MTTTTNNQQTSSSNLVEANDNYYQSTTSQPINTPTYTTTTKNTCSINNLSDLYDTAKDLVQTMNNFQSNLDEIRQSLRSLENRLEAMEARNRPLGPNTGRTFEEVPSIEEIKAAVEKMKQPHPNTSMTWPQNTPKVESSPINRPSSFQAPSNQNISPEAWVLRSLINQRVQNYAKNLGTTSKAKFHDTWRKLYSAFGSKYSLDMDKLVTSKKSQDPNWNGKKLDLIQEMGILANFYNFAMEFLVWDTTNQNTGLLYTSPTIGQNGLTSAAAMSDLYRAAVRRGSSALLSTDPAAGLELADHPDARPLEDFLPDDERETWKNRLRELGHKDDAYTPNVDRDPESNRWDTSPMASPILTSAVFGQQSENLNVIATNFERAAIERVSTASSISSMSSCCLGNPQTTNPVQKG